MREDKRKNAKVKAMEKWEDMLKKKVNKAEDERIGKEI